MMSKILRLNQKSKKEIYLQYADAMLIICLRYTGNKEDAEEVMHNGFLKAFKNMQKFKAKHTGSFSAWLKKIMINESLMFLRTKGKINIIPIEYSDIQEITTEFEQTYELDYLLELLNELPDGYRAVFNLYAVEGYKHKDIADLLGISENTSRTQLLKARKQLQQKLTDKHTAYGTI